MIKDDNAARAGIRNDVAAERRIVGSSELTGEGHRHLDAELLIVRFLREHFALEQHFRSEYVGLSLEQVGYFGVERLLAIMNEAVHLPLIRQGAMTGFMELYERHARLRRIFVDDYKPFMGLKKAQDFAQRRFDTLQPGFSLVNKLFKYRTNIQISEINALNACLAVIRFKQLRGFYFEEIPYYHLLLELGDLKIVGESEL